MSDVFISYARSTEAQAKQIAEALRGLGFEVWRDDQLPAHRAYAAVIEERLEAAKAVLVLWSADAVASQWVFSEANRAREDGKLVQLSLDRTRLPMPFDSIQCVDLAGWSGDLAAHGWKKVTASVADLVGARAGPPSAPVSVAAPVRKHSICVLPFTNMSGDAEQAYFSDGITEDIITDLSKVSALSVVSRNSAFRYKGEQADIPRVVRDLNVSHVLEGSVRKAGGRVRITAQLIDGAANDHIWAERYDRDLSDIFALQDEISEAIVTALKLRLLPAEKRAIERRGTDNAEAYDLYLLARQGYWLGNIDARQCETVIRLCSRAVEIDPGYTRAWALMGRAQAALRFVHGKPGVDSWATVEKVLSLDPALAEAHALKAAHLHQEGRYAETAEPIRTALDLDPECYEANDMAAKACFTQRRFADAIPYLEKVAALMDSEAGNAAMLISCYSALGDIDGTRRAARMTLERAETILTQDRSNGSAMGHGVVALAMLGEADRCRDWISRALLIDPANRIMRYNFACALAATLKDIDGALNLLGAYLAGGSRFEIDYAKADPDLDALRGDPRFQAMMAEAEARLAVGSQAEVKTPPV